MSHTTQLLGPLDVDMARIVEAFVQQHRLRLAHRSGIADYYVQRGPDGRTLYERFAEAPARSWPAEALLERARELGPRFPPGEGSWYSDTNYLLLGLVVEAATGQALHSVLETQLLEPLGLGDTWMVGHPRSARQAARTPAAVFDGGRDISRLRANPVYGADGGLISTAPEMVAFIHALAGGRLISRAALQAMHDWQPLEFPMQYGYGTMRFALPSAIAWMAGLPPMWGHSGSTGSFLYFCEERGVTLAGTLDQVSRIAPFRLMRGAMAAL